MPQLQAAAEGARALQVALEKAEGELKKAQGMVVKLEEGEAVLKGEHAVLCRSLREVCTSPCMGVLGGVVVFLGGGEGVFFKCFKCVWVCVFLLFLWSTCIHVECMEYMNP